MIQNLPNDIFNSINDFVLDDNTKPLGCGSFGVVKKAWHKMTNKIYAIKIIALNQNMSEAEITLLIRQISVHYQLNHPHIIKLWAVIQQKTKVYLIMDYAENGNLFNFLTKRKTLTQLQSFKIFYQALDAIDYLHKLDVFHRDIKPQNILLDHELNIKLCDFGWVADNINRKRTTFCGTYEYMAPEMVREIPYNYKIDIWALGILLYELNHGKAPFQADSVEVIKQKFQKGVYQIKQSLSDELKCLIVGLLQFDPSKRTQIAEIKKCDWVTKWKRSYSNANTNTFKNLLSGQNKRSNSNTLKVIDQKYLNENQNRPKKYRKKYRTLEEEDLYCITQNMKTMKNSTYKDIHKHLEPTPTKQNYFSSNFSKQRQSKDSPIKTKTSEKKQITLKKKKIGNSKSHIRTGTETSELLQKKLSKIIFQQKLKFLHEDRKKKQNSKRN